METWQEVYPKGNCKPLHISVQPVLHLSLLIWKTLVYGHKWSNIHNFFILMNMCKPTIRISTDSNLWFRRSLFFFFLSLNRDSLAAILVGTSQSLPQIIIQRFSSASTEWPFQVILIHDNSLFFHKIFKSQRIFREFHIIFYDKVLINNTICAYVVPKWYAYDLFRKTWKIIFSKFFKFPLKTGLITCT